MLSAARIYNILLVTTAALIPVALYMCFVYAPPEIVMGAVQRIFYFHVSAAIASYVSFALLFFACIGLLVTKNRVYDALAVASVEVAFLLTSIVLGSGMIWGKAAWGVWFNAEPRLVTFLLLWLLLLGYLALRKFGAEIERSSYSAVLGVIICITVPLMIFSIKLLPAFQQLHPEVIEKGGLHPDMRTALLFCIIAMLALQGLLITLRYRIVKLEGITYD